ncbi:MAG: HEAT repeat domain-containing protein [Planctomycetota bacterium]|jgi:hypothetical protein
MRRPIVLLRSAILLVAPMLFWLGVVPGEHGAVRSAYASEELEELSSQYEVLVRRRDDRGYQEQHEVLTRIADRQSPAAQRALRRLLARHGDADYRRAGLILEALVRCGSPADADMAIAWVEERHDPLLLETLDRIVAGACLPATQAHLRGDALKRAVPYVKPLIARGLGAAGDPQAVPALLPLLKEVDLRVRFEALHALGMLADARAVGPILVFLHDRDPRIRDASAHALGMIGDGRAVPGLQAALNDENPQVVESAAAALALLEDPTSIPVLIDRLKVYAETDLRIAHALSRALHRITGKTYGIDVDTWVNWWNAVKDRPWVAPEERPEGETVAGARYYGFPVLSSKVVFVLDISRSMGWNDRLDAAKEELTKVLEHLPPTTRFNLVFFSDEPKAWRDRLQVASPANVRRAISYLKRQRAENGTNTYDALRAALRIGARRVSGNRDDPDADTIFLLSDGHPSVGPVTQPDRILAEMRNWNRYRRVHVHCVALVKGAPPPRFIGTEDAERSVVFMRSLAEENGGLFKLIR